MATIPARAFPKPERVAGKTGTLTKGAAKTDALTTVLGYAATESAVNIGDAAVIVSGGRGVSNNPSLTPPAGMDEKQAELWRAQQGFAISANLPRCLAAQSAHPARQWTAAISPTPIRLGRQAKW